MASIKEVAKLANTSITTVSRVINNTGYVKDETKERILDAIKELGYKPLERADGKRETKAIGLIVPNIENPFFGKMARHIGKIANLHKYNLLLFDLEGTENHRDDFLIDLIEKRVDGLIYVSSYRCIEAINAAKKRNIPFVILDREIQKEKINTVIVDNNYGAFIATEHLIKLGHKNIAFIGGAEVMEISIKRKEGYVEALTKNGIQVNNDYICYGNYKIQSGYECMKKLYSKHKEITGVIAANDLMAIGALNYLIKEGVNVPKDVSIVGFDNIEISESITPALTTIEYPMERISEIVIDLILREIKDKDKNIEVISLYPKLIGRESCSSRIEK
ncbi:LacI family transcriptional regulator [Clostridium sporogenes]|uniref:LacI family DNA-binding transcriptional regulator n=1 Tax=Clostridium sporogenes TaxID=1509 RepID=UPI0005F07E9B|nr:LacI family DNA-binding transcriptional regulator [Clostridium sporogenes]NFF79155.1 LacI family transcriptional regulator [Clostridium sporogenes]NFL79648.1 LacI family transcriptional regulator [Clostridium sporogenes]NFU39254.1 LacI family transcriptional regulator [Clostridium sporogenes]NFU79161.1 LacI family transcriptional regulator [Clostridium sporogenes]